MLGDLDRGIRQPLLPTAVVMGARLSRQRLESRAQHSPTFRVEDSIELDAAVFAGADPEHAVLHLLLLLSLKALAVSGVPVVVADVIELARRVLARLFQQRSFVELGCECVRRPGHRFHVSKPDLALGDGLHTFGHSLKVLADRDQVGRGVARHVAVEADPVDRAGRAILVPRIGGGKFSRLPGECDLLQIDHMTPVNQALTSLLIGQVSGAGWVRVLRREHKKSLTMHLTQVRVRNRFLSSRTIPALSMTSWTASPARRAVGNI